MHRLRSRRTGIVVAVVGALALVAVAFVIAAPRPPGYRHLATWGEGDGPGALGAPIGIAVSGDEVFVTDSEQHRVVVYSLAGQFLRAFGERGDGATELDRPMHLAVRGGRVYVADYLNDRIQIFSTAGESLGTLGEYGSGAAQFDAPAGVAVDESGRLYVADFYNQRVQILDATGSLVRQIGRTGEKGILPGRFNYPTDVELLAGGELAVADAYNDRVQVFGPDGDPRRRWGGPFAIGLSAPFRGWFRVASGVGIGTAGDLFVTDFYNGRVQRFTAQGDLLDVFGERGSGPGQLDRPTDVAASADGSLYVVDFGNGRVHHFAPVEAR